MCGHPVVTSVPPSAGVLGSACAVPSQRAHIGAAVCIAWVNMIVSKHISLEATFMYFGRMHQNRLMIHKLMSW